MLSQIENGSARPSMPTLQYLASRLGKRVGFFLEEETVSENQTLISHARRAYQAGEYAEAKLVLQGFSHPDETFDLEYRYLVAKTTLHAAREAMVQGKTMYARQLLEELDIGEAFADLERKRLLLLGQMTDAGLPQLCRKLKSVDEELYLRARAALEERLWERGLALLDAMESCEKPEISLLRGNLLMGKEDYDAASRFLTMAEADFPNQTIPMLEQCYRELGDFKQAYAYACKQR
jgi:transcriptional regulator with XRE-family HTH domain